MPACALDLAPLYIYIYIILYAKSYSKTPSHNFKRLDERQKN